MWGMRWQGHGGGRANTMSPPRAAHPALLPECDWQLDLGRDSGKSLSYNMWEGPSDGAEERQFIHGFPLPLAGGLPLTRAASHASGLHTWAGTQRCTAGLQVRDSQMGPARRQSWNQRLGGSKGIQRNLIQATCGSCNSWRQSQGHL